MIGPGPSVLKLANFVNGSPFKPADLGEVGLPVIRIRQLLDSRATTERAVPPDRPVIIEQGDLVFSWSATLAVRHWYGGRALLNQHLFRVDPLPGIDSRWLGYALQVGVEYLKPLMHGSAMTHITLDMLRMLTVSVPRISRQRAIADYLDTETNRIDTLITKKRRMIELLKERWIAMVTDATTASGRNGSRIALRRVVESTIGGAWGKDPGQGDLDALCVRGTDFDTAFLRVDNDRAPTRGFTHEEFQRRRLVDGDLVIEKSGGGDKQPVGRAVQWSGDDAGIPTNFAARLRPAAGVNSRFLAFLLRASYETGVTRRWIKQTTGIQNLDLGGFLSEKYAIPPPREQSSIAEQLDEATSHRSLMQGKLHTQIGLLAERRQALITAAVTGELSVA